MSRRLVNPSRLAALTQALVNDAAVEEILNLLPASRPIRVDVLAYALNTTNRDLEYAVSDVYQDLLFDQRSAEDLWIYSLIYGRDDLTMMTEERLGEKNLPWNRLLPIAVYEDIDILIELSLLNGRFTVDDLLVALEAAYRVGDQEYIDQIGAMLAPHLAEGIAEGYYTTILPTAAIPYRVLFQDSPARELPL